MELSNKAAYLQGLVDGLGVDESTKEGKIIKAMSALLAEMAEALEGMDEDLSRAYDQINDLSDELEDLEADLYEDEDDDEDEGDEDDDDEDEDDDEEDADDANDDDIASEPFYEVACPNCGETVYVSEDDLDAGEANCAHCGVTFEVALEGDEEEPDEDAPVQYEVTCPDCGTTAVFEEEELLEGEPKCPNCGKPLDFEVTEE
jgi:formylmethanofuran dehydrogenase subunit E